MLYEDTCLFSFGVISDIQYANIENRLNYNQTCTRYYCNALVLLKEAIQHWTNSVYPQPGCIMQLGDILDGFNSEGGKKQSHQILNTILDEFDKLPCRVHHVFGNHEFYNFTRAELMNDLFSGTDYDTTERDCLCSCLPDIITTDGLSDFNETTPAAYYHFSPYSGFRFIVLDSFNRSVVGHGQSCPMHQDSLSLLHSVNKNKDLNSSQGLSGAKKRFVMYNGGLGETQMAWLDEVLQNASCAKEKVIVFGHTPIFPLETNLSCLLWDYQEALDLLRSYRCVVAAVSGHTHEYIHTVDELSGIHFLSLPGIIEIVPGSNGFGTILVYHDQLILQGVGEVKSAQMRFRQP